MAAPRAWRKVFSSVSRSGLARAFTRLSRRVFRQLDRGRRSSSLLLAPLLGEAVPRVIAQSAPPCSSCSDGISRFRWIGEMVPAFGISGKQVTVLYSPLEFYSTMKAQIQTAKRRVVMASLYLGTGPLEQELVECLQNTLETSLQDSMTSDLRISILLDFTRGSRGLKNSRTMLLPLLSKFPDQVRVSLYHTPDLRGLLKLLIPERFNETIGLQHIKVYLFDDNVIISGANLSESYFTNRQDRYILLRQCPEIADFFTELVEVVGDISLQLCQDDTVVMKEGMVHPYQGKRSKFCKAANEKIMEVVRSARTRQNICHTMETSSHGEGFEEDVGSQSDGDIDTWIYPLIQMKPFGVRLDETVTKKLLTEEEGASRIYLTSGYFNLTKAYMKLVLGAKAQYQILLASPEVNGFFGAKGVAGAIPAAYVYIARQFYEKVCRLGLQERIKLHEYFRNDWTFHAKGLWYYLPGSNLPCLSLIGSPNFGYRSVHRDLEAQIAIVTENGELQQQLQLEQLYDRSSQVSPSTFKQPNRFVKLWVKLVTPFIKNFF
ncbi:CDP-diacylglycerol--glycerol-3-phosphate 3-phosphatidyltransferase, mitochondrial isoform X2 [Latimeria chalumnae]|uniref:CDP-diacylglycerol--glycerol-3-phosphate 3-phosphatidyltransferase, mitochondrial isoform X2 n=1 Tax=Latimeria chalumnae TaxID=7897 RepID=UPI0003C108CF|nr:PREDICTED: CDP-diacylglycerol--glycerol-3-phosphate 3-phosphatidyltransferase, mitochondrial isoform X2 [Latimeria chalumnae]|eukprot:XP_005989149.1 PREDICTED: CDP-diacylglycerol--glycerol-3-phosphate 3-phosphatidyltransferase, mitochondrial isoform X2 [Latimeria chalumnae]